MNQVMKNYWDQLPVDKKIKALEVAKMFSKSPEIKAIYDKTIAELRTEHFEVMQKDIISIALTGKG